MNKEELKQFEDEFFIRLEEKLDDIFPKTNQDNPEIPSEGNRSGAISFNAFANIIFKDILEKALTNQRNKFIEIVKNIDEFEETYCKKDEQLFRAIKKEIIEKIKKTMNIKDKIRDICTYHTKGETSGYLLDEDRFAKIFALLDTQQNINQPIGSTTDFIIEIIKQHFQTTLPTDAENCAQEINEIIQEKLRFQYDKGYDAGVKHYQQHIDEALNLYQVEYANTKMKERPDGYTVLQDIKKINK